METQSIPCPERISKVVLQAEGDGTRGNLEHQDDEQRETQDGEEPDLLQANFFKYNRTS